MQQTEGFIDFKGYKTWYSVFGDLNSGTTPLVILHGGPGYPHYHLQNLSRLADRGIPVILYDQLGCGKSDRPDDVSLWTVDLFIDELNEIRKVLKLKTVNVLGHSWGGSLAAEYALSGAEGIDKLILSSPLLDTELWVKEADKLKDLLPKDVADTMREHEAAGTTDSKEYSAAYHQFVKQFICRLDIYPEAMLQADEEWGLQVYQTMWGPSEAYATGTLKDWSLLDRLSKITQTTLLLSGRHDEATPAQISLAHQGINGSKWIIFENSSHAANFEEPELYLNTVEQFLKDQD